MSLAHAVGHLGDPWGGPQQPAGVVQGPAWVAATSDTKAPEERKAMMDRGGSLLSSREGGYSYMLLNINT